MPPRYKVILVFLLLVISSRYAFGQQVTWHIKGKILTSARQPVSLATVRLFDKNHQQVVQIISDSNGVFDMAYAVKGSYSLSITHAGFKEYSTAIFELAHKDLGSITLLPDSQVLEGVTVVAKQKLIELEGNSLVYNVSKSIAAQGMSALEALQKAPGVYVDNNNDISLQGKRGVLILLDGKQTYVSGKELVDLLRSMPSSSIRSIEITTNPGAKYDAAGSAGIINIRTLKSLVKGFSGTVTAGGAYGISPKQNLDIGFNYRVNDLNIYGSYNHFLGNYNYAYGSDRIQKNKFYNSFTDDVDKRQRMGGRLGMDYSISKRSTIGLLVNGNFLFGGGITQTKTDIGTIGSPVIEQVLTAVNDYYFQPTDRYNVSANYRYEDSTGHLFSIDADYGTFQKGNKNLQSNRYTNNLNTLLDQTLYRSFNSINIKLKAIKADYAADLWKGKFETGVKFSAIETDNDARFFHVMASHDSVDERRTNTFTFKEEIASGYLSYKKAFGKWSIQGGLRVENTASDGFLFLTVKGIDSTQRIKRNFTNFFPSFSVSVKPKDNHQFSLAYSTRIDRPAYQDLNPFIYLLDELSFWQGNPFLQPQLTQRLSLQYAFKNSTVISINYSHTDQYSTRITDTIESAKIVMVPRNLGVQNNISLSLTQLVSPTKWWDMTFNGTLYQLHNKMSFDQYRSFDLKQLAGRANLQQVFKLPYKITGEVATTFVSGRLTGANEFSRSISQLDLGLQRSFLDGKLTARLACTDIYKGSQSNSVQEFNGFYMRVYGYYETRQLRVNITYKFTDSKAKAPRTRSSALENENGRVK